MIDTAGTLCAASAALKEEGARRVVAYCVHPVLSGKAIDNINRSQLVEIVVTDTIPLGKAARESGHIRQLSVAQMLAETIRRMAEGEAVSSLYVDWQRVLLSPWQGVACSVTRQGATPG